jgi:hypothetical protein
MRISKQRMEIGSNWANIRRVFNNAMQSSLHFAFATVNPDGSPHVAPIGSLILQPDNRGFYCDEFPRHMPRNFQYNRQVCVLAVNSSRLFWLKSLWRGKFHQPPAIRLNGVVGDRRQATEGEMAQWHRRVSRFKHLKGHHLLWRDMQQVRDIAFDSFEPLSLGKMGSHAWFSGY